MDEFEQKLCSLCHFTVSMVISNKERHYRMFKRNIRDDIRIPVAASIHSQCSQCVESAHTSKRSVPKLIPNEAIMNTKVKVENPANEI